MTREWLTDARSAPARPWVEVLGHRAAEQDGGCERAWGVLACGVLHVHNLVAALIGFSGHHRKSLYHSGDYSGKCNLMLINNTKQHVNKQRDNKVGPLSHNRKA